MVLKSGLFKAIILTLAVRAFGLLNDTELQLVRDLLVHYDPDVRPVIDKSQAVTVTVGLSVRQILELDEKNQVIYLNLWNRREWIDENLRWEPKDYGNITDIRLSPKRVWMPDVVIYSELSHDEAEMKSYSLSVKFNGEVFWNPRSANVQSICKVQVLFFPFDVQVCELKYGSWTFSSDLLDVRNATLRADTSSFLQNAEWELLSVPAARHEVHYSIGSFSDVTFYITIRRKPLYYMFNLLLPCLLMLIINTIGLYLPPESGEKISLGVTVLLSLTVFLMIVAEKMPTQSEVIPLIGIYFIAAIVIMSMSVASSVLVLNIHHRGGRGQKIPQCVKVIFFSCLAKLLCIQVPDFHKRTKYKSPPIMERAIEEETNLQAYVNGVSKPNGSPPKPKDNDGMQNIFSFVQHLQRKTRDDEIERDLRDEWQMLAYIINQIFLILFFTLTGLVIGFVLFFRPGPYSTV